VGGEAPVTPVSKPLALSYKPCDNRPYRVIRRIGELEYEIELPEGSKIHNVFQVSCLKEVVGQ
jgi:hypothetical protein